MTTRSHTKRLLVLATLTGSLAVSTGAGARSIYVLTTDNRIAVVPETQPGLAASTAVAVTGLDPADLLMAIDVRPQNARLYGLGFNAGAGSVRLYHITVDATGVRASPVGSTSAFSTAGGSPAPINGSSFGIDFNPAVDRLRVSNNTGQNFRMIPNTGALVDGDAVNPGMQMDGPISGGTTTVDDTAHTNNFANNGNISTLYTVDGASNRLFIQNPANIGTQTIGQLITLGGSTLDFSGEIGFDIPLGVNAASSNAPATGDALCAFSVGGISGLYRLALSTGEATALGTFGLFARDIAFAPETAPAIAIDPTGTSLLRFSVLTPGTITTQAINSAAIPAGERLVGIDGRPSTGQLYGLGINPMTNTGTLYLIDPQTGGVSLAVAGTASALAFAGADFPDASWGFDFNPVIDRIRVISSSGVNFRVNPFTGLPAAAVLDGAINGPTGIGIAGTAYTNNQAGAAVTTLYTLDPLGNRLFIQNPPNNGTQTIDKIVTLNGLPFDFDTVSGFDIPPGVNAAASNGDVAGEGYVATSAGATTLYTIMLSSGALQRIGTIGAGATPIEGLVVWLAPNPTVFRNGFESPP